MRTCLRPWILAACFCFGKALLWGAAASGQVVRLRNTRVAKPELVTGSFSILVNPSSVSFNLVQAGQSRASAAISITSNIDFTIVGNISLYGFFSSSSALTTTAGDVIPASSVYGEDPSGSCTTMTAFTQTTPFSGNSGLLIYQLKSLLSFAGTRTDPLSLMVDTTAEPQLPAGTYTGTLTLEAQAF